jgi:hypothetical protein
MSYTEEHKSTELQEARRQVFKLCKEMTDTGDPLALYMAPRLRSCFERLNKPKCHVSEADYSYDEALLEAYRTGWNEGSVYGRSGIKRRAEEVRERNATVGAASGFFKDLCYIIDGIPGEDETTGRTRSSKTSNHQVSAPLTVAQLVKDLEVKIQKLLAAKATGLEHLDHDGFY